MSSILLETDTLAGIPILACLPAQRDPCPVVFAIPGYGGDRSSLLRLARRLAEAGLACVSFDPLYHGLRADPILHDAARPEMSGIYPPETGLDIYRTFLQVIRQCSLDVQTLLAALAGDARLDLQHAGVTGMSLGAYAAFLAFAEIPALHAAVPVMGIPTFTRRWLDLLDECAWSNPAWAAALEKVEDQTRATTAWVESFDPAEKLLACAPRALLAMNGDMDTDQPTSYTLNWLRAARPAYADSPDRLRWNVYPVAHTFTPEMEQDAVEWLVQNLF